MELDPTLSDEVLFQTCLDRGGRYTFLTSGATRKEKQKEAALRNFSQECARRGVPAEAFLPARRERSRPP
eukprot:10180051-Alexandrium_andersonii.AAC.1